MPELRVDLEVPLAEATIRWKKLLRHFEPFGIGNPAPLLATRGSSWARPLGYRAERSQVRVARRDHCRRRLVGCFASAAEWSATQVVDVAYRLERGPLEGQRRVCRRLCDIRG